MLRPLFGVGIGWVGISMLADGLPSLLLPHQLLSAGEAGAATLGIATLLSIGVAALIQPLAGRLSDRIGRGPIMAAGTLIALAGLALLAVPTLTTALGGTALALIGVSVAQSGYQALLPDRIGPRWRGRAGGLKSAFDVAGATLGFVLIAGAIGSGAPQLATLVLGVTLVAGFGAAYILLGRGAAGNAADPTETLPRMPIQSEFIRLVTARFLFLLGIYAVGRFLLLFVAERLRLGPDSAGEAAGGTLALLALVTVVASVPAGWLADRLGRRPVMLLGGGLAAAGIVLLSTATSLVAVTAFGSLLSLGSAAFASASWALLADLTAPGESGRLLGIANLATAGAAALAGLFGLVIDAGGFAVAFSAAAASTLAGGLVAWQLVDERGAARVPIGAPDEARS